MPATIKDIARAIGVDPGTVSRALNNKRGVSDALRQQIVEKAEELGYRPDGRARSLVTRRTESIGLFAAVPTTAFLADPANAAVFAGVEAEASFFGLALTFASLEATFSDRPGLDEARRPFVHSMDESGLIPKCVLDHRLDGSVIVGTVDIEMLRRLHELEHPFVMVESGMVEGEDVLSSDSFWGMREATEHLLELGHKNVAFVGGERLYRGSLGVRLEGYRKALVSAGIPFERVVEGTPEKAEEVLDTLLKQEPDVTGILAANDVMAVEIMRALHIRGRKIPKQMSVIGFGDIPSAARSAPPLTTVKIDCYSMGRQAVRRLIQKMSEGAASIPRQVLFPAELVVRSSTDKPRKT